MRAAGKIFKLFLLLIIIVSAMFIAASFILQDQVGEIILSSINRNISTKIYVGSFRLSFLKKFPKASLELNNVSILSSDGFNKEAFRGINTDTLLIADIMSVDFRSTDIIRGVYDIGRIGIRNGKITLFTDSGGLVNYKLTDRKGDSGITGKSLNLQRILLSDMKITYNNLATKLLVEGKIIDGRISTRISGENISLNSETDLLITGIQQNNIKITSPFNAGLELKMDDTEKGIFLRKGVLSVEGFRFGISGTVSPENDLNLEFKGENIDLSRIRKYLPEEYLNFLTEYDLSGSLQLNSQVTGRLSNISNPHVELNFILDKGGMIYPETGISIRNISFRGFFSNGSKNSPETAFVSINNINALLGSADYTGKLIIRNFTNPITELEFKGRIFPAELNQFFRLSNISVASGYCDLDLMLKTDFWPEDSITIYDLVSLKPEASVKFNSLDIGLRDGKQVLNNVNGEVILSRSLTAKNLRFIYKGQKIGIDGEFINLPEWAAGHPVNLKADAYIYFDKLIPETLTGKSQSDDKKIKKEQAFILPDDLFLNINLKIDSLKNELLPSSDINVNLVYQPGMLTFNSLTLNTLSGIITGNGFISQNSKKSLMARGSFNISDININKTFTSFRNFGQNFLQAENIAGNLTGSLTLLLPMDSLLKPQIKSMVAEGKYTINDGSLIDFEPVKELSAFIELSELENIQFEKLENDFFIRNNFLYIPQMEVNSSAADLTINGKHNFDNSFEYHVKILLSELLSKKRRKTKNNTAEFGAVEDDGLGRTSLLLRIESKGDEIKVGYDVKAAGNKVKSSIKTERQSMKTILNQEYGFYKSDTLPAQKPAEKKPRFRITWDESDTLNNEPDPGSIKKENALKRLLKKK